MSRGDELCVLVDHHPLGIDLVAEKLLTHSPARMLARFQGRAHRLRDARGERPLEAAVRGRLEAVGAEARTALQLAAAFESPFTLADLAALGAGAEPWVGRASRLGLVRPRAGGLELATLARDTLRADRGHGAHVTAVHRLLRDRALAWAGTYDAPGGPERVDAVVRLRADLAATHGRLAVAAARDPKDVGGALLAVAEALERGARREPDPTIDGILQVTIELTTGVERARALLLRAWSALVRGVGPGADDAARAASLIEDAPGPHPVALRLEARCLVGWCTVCEGHDDASTERDLLTVAASPEASARVRGEALAAAGRIALRRRALGVAAERYASAVTAMNEADAVGRLPLLELRRGIIAREQSALGEATSRFREAEVLAASSRDAPTAAAARTYLALVRAEGDATTWAPGFARVLREADGPAMGRAERDRAFALHAAGQIAMRAGAWASLPLSAALTLVRGDAARASDYAALLAWALHREGDAEGSTALLERIDTPLANYVREGRDGRFAPPASALERLVAGSGPPNAIAPIGRPTTRVGSDGRSLWRGGQLLPVREGVLRRLLRTLAEARLARPGRAVEVYELFARVWPDEPRTHPEAMATRIYVAVHELRSVGLGSELVSDGGYRLSTSVSFVLTPIAPSQVTC